MKSGNRHGGPGKLVSREHVGAESGFQNNDLVARYS